MRMMPLKIFAPTHRVGAHHGSSSLVSLSLDAVAARPPSVFKGTFLT